jgi:hypothetical protein
MGTGIMTAISTVALSVAVMSGSAAFAAAHRLNDAQMDHVTAGLSSSASASSSEATVAYDASAHATSSASSSVSGAAAQPDHLSVSPQTFSTTVTGNPAFASAGVSTTEPLNGAGTIVSSASQASAFSSSGTASASATTMPGGVGNDVSVPLQANGFAALLGGQFSAGGLRAMLPSVR